MIIIGELINSTRKKVQAAIEQRNSSYIQELAQQQEKAGCSYIDLNAAASTGDEKTNMIWLVNTVQAVSAVPLALDSPDPAVIEAALAVCEGIPLVNSISAEKERYRSIIPLLQKTGAKVIALCAGDEGIPETAEGRVSVAVELLEQFGKDGIPPANILFDPLVKPLSVSGEEGQEVLKAIERIAKLEKGLHITCGLSNISFGLPYRHLLNTAFLILAMGRGLDAVIMDPCDHHTLALIKAVNVATGNDLYAVDYIKASREGLLG